MKINLIHNFIFQKGLVIGVYTDKSGDNVKLTPSANQINQECNGEIFKALKM